MLLKQALEERRVVRFLYNGETRFVEPHTLGFGNDKEMMMRGYQLEKGWRLFKVAQMDDLVVVPDRGSIAPRPGYKAGDSAMREIIAELPA